MDDGEESRARSEEDVKSNISKAISKANEYSPDFILMQEIDTESTRACYVNELDLLDNAFASYDRVFANNYHSAFLFYPFIQPIGSSESGICTYSNQKIASALRRSLPISTGVSKILDLDRCYSVTRIPVENGKELVLYNVHFSAYGTDTEIGNSQIKMLLNDMQAEYEKGNYTVCGGDYNHDFTGTSLKYFNGLDSYKGWTEPFNTSLIPSGIRAADTYDQGKMIPSCRDANIPYGKDSVLVIVDGFFVSENVQINSLQNVQTEFEYSDHNPVVMQFTLL